MNADEKYNLIAKNLQEIIGSDDLKKLLTERDLKIYWGTATTGKPHIAYFLPIIKISDFLRANCHVKILLADIHAFLDNLKAPFEQIESRAIYYEKIIKAMFKSLGIETDESNELCKNKNESENKTNLNISINVNLEKLNINSEETRMGKLEFVMGSSFQTSSKYTMDLYKISTLISERDAKKAGAQVVKQVDNPLLSSMIYPSMQALDEEYLDVDAQFGGVDQRKIFTYAMKYLPLLNYRKRIHLMNCMIPGLNSEKMSSSDVYSKIDLCDSKKDIQKKIRRCFCEEGNVETGLLSLLRFIIFPIYEIRKKSVVINRKDKASLVFDDYLSLEKDFIDKNIHPADLKDCVAEMVDDIVSPVRQEMLRYSEITDLAYCTMKKKKNK